MTPQKKTIFQPTTFGKPRPVMSRRFYRVVGRWFSMINAVLYPLVISSFLVFFSLLAYTGLGIELSQIFVSDGTVFSCQIDAPKRKRNQ